MIIRNGYTITPVASVSAGGEYQIKVAELGGVTFNLSMGNVVLQTKTTFPTTGGIVTFNVADTGTYKVTALNGSVELWSNEVTVDLVGIYTVKVPDSSTGYAMNRYTVEQLHNICQNGYFSTMFSIGDKWNFRQEGSIMDNYDYFVEDVVTNGGGEEVLFRSCSPYQEGRYDITPSYYFLRSNTATSWSYNYLSRGGYKYSAMRQRMQARGEEVYMQATSIKGDDATIETGIPFGQLYYSDTGELGKIYTYDGATDTFTEVETFEYGDKGYFMNGYFKSVGTLTEEVFNAGHYYTYASSVYTPASTYDSSVTYYGYYKTLQDNGIFYDAHSSLLPYLARLDDKASSGYPSYTSIVQYSDYIDIPTVEQVTGTNSTKALFSSRNAGSKTYGRGIYSWNVAGEGEKRPAYNSFDKQVAGTEYWTASPNSSNSSYFCCVDSDGSIYRDSVSYGHHARLGFRLK